MFVFETRDLEVTDARVKPHFRDFASHGEAGPDADRDRTGRRSGFALSTRPSCSSAHDHGSHHFVTLVRDIIASSAKPIGVLAARRARSRRAAGRAQPKAHALLPVASVLGFAGRARRARARHDVQLYRDTTGRSRGGAARERDRGVARRAQHHATKSFAARSVRGRWRCSA
jgi:hypothetical protein